MSTLHGWVFWRTKALPSSPSHSFPPAAAFWVMARTCVCCPPPHSLLQPDHSIQSPKMQGTGMIRLPQGSVRTSGPSQASPPNWGSFDTARCRDICKLWASQALHSPQGPNSHGSGGCTVMSQSMLSLVRPRHCTPPHTLGLKCLFLKQRPETPSFSQSRHSPHWQSWGQHSVGRGQGCASGQMLNSTMDPSQSCFSAHVSTPPQSALHCTVQGDSASAAASSKTAKPPERLNQRAMAGEFGRLRTPGL
mmetsp:Transcript_105644/g.251907  ORF Transcript_105644/g.251907 Transcript_105644/m.251907 type:complete len:249 (-) Transcript_105644:8-754(-)